MFVWLLLDNPCSGHNWMLHCIHFVLLHYYPCWFRSVRCDCFLCSQIVKDCLSSQTAASSCQPAAGCKMNKERETSQCTETAQFKLSCKGGRHEACQRSSIRVAGLVRQPSAVSTFQQLLVTSFEMWTSATVSAGHEDERQTKRDDSDLFSFFPLILWRRLVPTLWLE